ncbi:hypothetical protein C8F04DRAFT_1115654, partial [Mycena alexandri]
MGCGRAQRYQIFLSLLWFPLAMLDSRATEAEPNPTPQESTSNVYPRDTEGGRAQHYQVFLNSLWWAHTSRIFRPSPPEKGSLRTNM